MLIVLSNFARANLAAFFSCSDSFIGFVLVVDLSSGIFTEFRGVMKKDAMIDRNDVDETYQEKKVISKWFVDEN